MQRENDLNRRAFLARSSLAGTGLILGGVPIFADASRTRRKVVPYAGSGGFAESVASGDPTTSSVQLWTRLGGYTTDRRLTLEVASDPQFRRVVHRRDVVARAARDHCVKAHVRGRFLKPGARYWYRFHTRRQTSPVGRFQTLRPADSAEPVRIAFCSCADWESGWFGAYEAIARDDDLDLVVFLGDYVYERNFWPGADVRPNRLGANRDGEVQTLDEYRSAYKFWRTDGDLRRVHEQHAWVGTWDDHEVEDNYSAGLPGGETADVRVPFAQRRANGFLAFAEYMPYRLLAPGTRLYRTLKLGRHADLFLLDQRQYRDDQPCDDSAITNPGCSYDVREAPGRTYLGAAQKRWLKDGLRASQATWKLVGNPLMIMSVDVVPRQRAFTVDSWDGYGAERTELLRFIRDRNIRNVSFLTGDIHTYFAGEVHENGRKEGKAPIATEFVGGSISSRGVTDTLREAANAPLPDAAILAVVDNIRTANPHIVYYDFDAHGYAVAEASASQLKVDYVAVEGFTRRSTTPRTLASFVVRDGVPGVVRA